MEEEARVEVGVVSTQIVKPSSPTPQNKQSLALSFLDQSFPAVSLPAILVYTKSQPTTTESNVVSGLKSSLAETLTTFYPLAGRCGDDNTVSCNDQGIPFRETHVNCRLTDVLNSPPHRKLDLLSSFLPPVDIFSYGNRPISDFPPLSFQVNVFQCGGIVIGCYFFHKLLDAASLACFLNYWAAIASNRHPDLVHPIFDATIAAFPPPPPKVAETQKSGGDNGGFLKLWQSLKSIKVVGKSFIFNRATINELKAIAATEMLPNPTAFEAVAGFVWQHITAVSIPEIEHAGNRNSAPSVLSFSANIRARTSPPFPKGSMGNLIVDLHACLEKCGDLSDYVKEIHSAILTVREKVETMKGEKGAEAFVSEREAGLQGYVKNQKATKYTLTSWCNLGFNGVDFGFGKPSKVIPFGMIHPFLRNTMAFLDYSDSDGEGIEVWLFLEGKEMQILESNARFRAFAAKDTMKTNLENEMVSSGSTRLIPSYPQEIF